MNNVNQWIVLSIILYFPLESHSFAQDIYSFDSSKKYAEYLYVEKEYSLAAMEFERLVFMRPGEVTYRVFLMKSYRKAGEYQSGLQTITNPEVSPDLAMEYGKLLLLSNQQEKFHDYLNANEMLQGNDHNYLNAAYLLQTENYHQAVVSLRQASPDNGEIRALREVADYATAVSFKSPALASALSAVIPGGGKMYCGYWQDGIISLLMIGVTAWQSYRGFQQDGSSSAYGWIYGGFSGALYLGNIYGSGKAANKHNTIQHLKIDQKLEEILRYSD